VNNLPGLLRVKKQKVKLQPFSWECNCHVIEFQDANVEFGEQNDG